MGDQNLLLVGSSTYVERRLKELGVDLLEPETKKDKSIARALEEFASFLLHDQPEETKHLLDEYIQIGEEDVGELQGGNEHASIYRVSIKISISSSELSLQAADRNSGKKKNRQKNQSSRYGNAKREGAVAELLRTFQDHHPQLPLSMDQLQDYLLRMCNDPRRYQRESIDGSTITFQRLENLMFIMSFGPVGGQVRHIDHSDPNVPIFMYLSDNCPSTIVYEPKGPPITDCRGLLDSWSSISTFSDTMPKLIRQILLEMGLFPLAADPSTNYFGFWKTLDSHLFKFGKLYQPVAQVLCLSSCRPGTTMLVDGYDFDDEDETNNGDYGQREVQSQSFPSRSRNQVHAGPPTTGPRMFAFAVGVPESSRVGSEEVDEKMISIRTQATNKEGPLWWETCYSENSEGITTKDEVNDGEIQYNAVLLHIDVCCILFTMMEFDQYSGNSEQISNTHNTRSNIVEAKRFLLRLLVPMIQEYPQETYSRLLGEDRRHLRAWLGELVAALDAVRTNMGANSKSLQRVLDDAIIKGLIERAAQAPMDADASIVSCPVIDRKIKKKGRSKKQRRGTKTRKSNNNV